VALPIALDVIEGLAAQTDGPVPLARVVDVLAKNYGEVSESEKADGFLAMLNTFDFLAGMTLAVAEREEESVDPALDRDAPQVLNYLLTVSRLTDAADWVPRLDGERLLAALERARARLEA
jgi:hypothetical protein